MDLPCSLEWLVTTARKCQAGDQKALRDLMVVVMPYVKKRAIQQLTRNRFRFLGVEDAEDAAMETVIALQCNMHKIIPETLQAWLFVVLRRKLVQISKSKIRAALTGKMLLLEYGRPPTSLNDYAALYAAIRGLPRDERCLAKIIIAIYWDDESYTSISRRTGTAYQAIVKWHGVAIKMLKESLEPRVREHRALSEKMRRTVWRDADSYYSKTVQQGASAVAENWRLPLG